MQTAERKRWLKAGGVTMVNDQWIDRVAALTERVAYLESVLAAARSAAEERIALLQELVRSNAELREALERSEGSVAAIII